MAATTTAIRTVAAALNKEARAREGTIPNCTPFLSSSKQARVKAASRPVQPHLGRGGLHAMERQLSRQARIPQAARRRSRALETSGWAAARRSFMHTSILSLMAAVAVAGRIRAGTAHLRVRSRLHTSPSTTDAGGKSLPAPVLCKCQLQGGAARHCKGGARFLEEGGQGRGGLRCVQAQSARCSKQRVRQLPAGPALQQTASAAGAHLPTRCATHGAKGA